jgi:Arm DNA-binding domain
MLSDAKIKSLKIEDGKRYKDRDGLVLEIRKSGKKVFLFRFQWNKKPQTITIGQYPSLSLKEARELVLNYKDMLNRKLDPRNNDAEKIESLLFKEVGDRWLQKIKHSLKEVTYNRHKTSMTEGKSRPRR